MTGTSQRPRLPARSKEGAPRTGPINPVAVFCDQFAGSPGLFGLYRPNFAAF